MIATNTIKASRGQASEKTRPVTRAPELAAALECARQAGLLDDERTEHLSFRAPKALIEAAKRESGIQSPTELGISRWPPSPSLTPWLRSSSARTLALARATSLTSDLRAARRRYMSDEERTR